MAIATPVPKALGVIVRLKSHQKAAIFLALCLALLFAPYVGDIRWVGLLAFLYIGLPWYILALRDNVEERVLKAERSLISSDTIFSPTLLIFGFLCVLVGIALDAAMFAQVFEEPGVFGLGHLATRLLIGAPFVGLGVYFMYLGVGKRKNDT